MLSKGLRQGLLPWTTTHYLNCTWHLNDIYNFSCWMIISIYNTIIDHSSCTSEIHINFNTVGNGNGCDFFDLLRCAFQVNISLVDGHCEGIPGLWTLTTGCSSGTNSQIFVGNSDWSSNPNLTFFRIANQLICYRLNGFQSVSTEGDSGLLHFLIFYALFLFFIGH